MKALKTFRDANKKRINQGDTVNKADYPDQILAQYERQGLIGPNEKKPAKPKQTKGKK